ncbi:MAG: GYD domain-containing protein [Candidatus Bathyarchaeota archaeon]|nr:GYD domain-containing protein [Candidatus Bathyarchaeota archaeon]
MPIYIILTTLTEKGKETIKINPDRILEVNKEIEAMGIKILAQYAVLGPFDFVNIVEAPDERSVAKLSIELGFRGSVHTLSMPAIPTDKLIEFLKRGK